MLDLGINKAWYSYLVDTFVLRFRCGCYGRMAVGYVARHKKCKRHKDVVGVIEHEVRA